MVKAPLSLQWHSSGKRQSSEITSINTYAQVKHVICKHRFERIVLTVVFCLRWRRRRRLIWLWLLVCACVVWLFGIWRLHSSSPLWASMSEKDTRNFYFVYSSWYDSSFTSTDTLLLWCFCCCCWAEPFRFFGSVVGQTVFRAHRFFFEDLKKPFIFVHVCL